MPDNSKTVVDFYISANENKDKIVQRNQERDYSYSEMTILACLDALFRHEYLASKENDWDVNKTIRMILADSLRGKTDMLQKKDYYDSLLKELDDPNSKEALMAKTSYFNAVLGFNSEQNDLMTLLKQFSKLRTTIRIGHILWDAHGDRLESVLEHIYGTIILILGIESEYGYQLDYDKIIQMLLIHEAEEIKKGDEPDLHKPHDQKLGKSIVEEIFANVPNGKKYIGLVDEIEQRLSIEGDYGKLADKEDYLLKVLLYDLQGRYDFANRPVNAATQNPEVLKIIEDGADTVFKVHYEFDKHRFQNFPAMRRILEQAKNLQN